MHDRLQNGGATSLCQSVLGRYPPHHGIFNEIARCAPAAFVALRDITEPSRLSRREMSDHGTRRPHPGVHNFQESSSAPRSVALPPLNHYAGSRPESATFPPWRFLFCRRGGFGDSRSPEQLDSQLRRAFRRAARVRLDLMLTGLTPHDGPHARSCGIAKRHRRTGLGSHYGRVICQALVIVGTDLLDVDDVRVARTAIAHAGGVGFRASRLRRPRARRRSVVQAPL